VYKWLSPDGAGMIVNLEQRYRRSEHVVFRKIHDETIPVPVKNNVGDLDSIYGLNPTGAFLWALIDGERSLLDIQLRFRSHICEADVSKVGDHSSVSF
jgi:hypothetical protein